MAAIREVVIGGVAGHMVAAVMEKMIVDTREAGLKHVLGYQHKHPGLEQIPFVDVYSEDDTARGKVNWVPAVFPEQGFHCWSIERVVVFSDDNPEERPGSTRRVVGMVIVRHPDTGPSRPAYDRVQRFKVELQYAYAENGNTYTFDATVTDFKPVADEDMALSQV